MSACTHGKEDHESCVKCALASPAPEIQANGEKSEPGGPEVRSSLISDLNAPVDPLTRLLAIEDRLRQSQALPEMTPHEIAEVMLGPDWCAGRDAERARIRAIVFRLLGHEYTGNAVLEAIDAGK